MAQDATALVGAPAPAPASAGPPSGPPAAVDALLRTLRSHGARLQVRRPGSGKGRLGVAPASAYAKLTEKWQRLSKDIGRDTDKFTEALWREVYSKLDPEKL